MKNCHIPNILKWLWPSITAWKYTGGRPYQIKVVIWEQDDNWSQWLYGLGKLVNVWQQTSCVAVSWYKKNSLFPLERLKESEEAWIETGMANPLFCFPQLPQLGFPSCSWYSWSKHIFIRKHILGSKCKQRHNQATDMPFQSTLCGLFMEEE